LLDFMQDGSKSQVKAFKAERISSLRVRLKA